MITRIARGDVVRLIRTGEVGTVKGWAEHDDLSKHGTVLDVQISSEKVIVANGAGLEFVANAKLKFSGAKAWWVFIVMALSIGDGAAVARDLAVNHALPWWSAVTLGFSAALLMWNCLFLFTIRPRKTKLQMPRLHGNPPSVQSRGRMARATKIN